jgi:putative DNA primase/helicase
VEGYSLFDVQIAKAPQWLITLSYEAPEKPTTKPEQILDDGEHCPIPTGERNRTLFREACRLRDAGIDASAALGAISVMYLEKCEHEPPMEEKELSGIVESAYRYAPKKKTAGRPKKDVAELATQIQEHGLESFTDTGNARRLVSRHGENLRYTKQTDWLVWDETHWIIDDTGQVERYCKDTAERIQNEALFVDPEEEKELHGDILRHANSSLNQARLDAMKKNASTEAELRIRHSLLDANPWLFNVNNGTLDLQDGTLRPHHRADHITNLASVLYDPDATSPNWFAFLDQIFLGDWDVIGYVQQVFGYALTGDISWQCLFLLHGSGQNGKSVLLDVLRLLVGDYGAQTDFNTFMVKRNNDTTRNDLAQLVNRRVVCGSEGDIGQHISEALIKQVTGEKRVNACFKYKEPFEYDVTFKVFLATNHLPNITGQDKGIWRRLRVIPFRYAVPDDQREPRLIEDKFAPELSGILNWALEGCRQWIEHSEQIPRAVAEATGQYREDMDPFGQFLKDCFDLDDPSAETPTRTILEMLKEWAQENHPPLAQTTGKGLAVKMAEKGIEKSPNKTKRGYRGLRPTYLAERKYSKETTGLNVHDWMTSLN